MCLNFDKMKMKFLFYAVADTWANVGGQAYCFDRMTSYISIVLEQKTIVFQNIGRLSPPQPPTPKVSTTAFT